MTMKIKLEIFKKLVERNGFDCYELKVTSNSVIHYINATSMNPFLKNILLGKRKREGIVHTMISKHRYHASGK